MTGIEKIKNWRSCFGLPNRDTPQVVTLEESNLAFNLIVEETSELKHALHPESNWFFYKPNLAEIADAIGDLYFVVTQAAMIHGLDPEMLIDRVYKSNMSKLCHTEDEAQDSIDAYREKGIDTYYNYLSDGKYIIKRTSDDKVLKGINFFEPDWTDLGPTTSV
jgi:predicted HAD superfamily Cof-like phosphohydrolase